MRAHVEKANVLGWTKSIACILKHNIYCMDKGSLKRVKIFAGKITYQRDIKLPRFMTCRECVIIK